MSKKIIKEVAKDMKALKKEAPKTREVPISFLDGEGLVSLTAKREALVAEIDREVTQILIRADQPPAVLGWGISPDRKSLVLIDAK